MPFLSRAGALLATVSLYLAAPVGALPIEVPVTQPLVDRLEHWLDAHTPYPRRDAPPRIVMVSAAQAASLAGAASRAGMHRRGLYDPEMRTIYLVRPWSAGRHRDVSVLLHELLHHRQATARHWYCPGAQEPDAYAAQEAWLAESGLPLDYNRIEVVLAAGCTPRDIHPD